MAMPKYVVLISYEEYLKGVLEQIDDSYTLLQNLHDKPGDLAVIKRETAKITGLLQALSNKVRANKAEFSEYEHLLSPAKNYLDNHDFFREMDMLGMLYSEDSLRLKNMRLTIIDALEEKNLMVHIKSLLRQ